MRVEKDFEDFIKLLNENDVRYLIIGAFAVSFHARPRFTGDIDFLIDPLPQNIENLLQAIKEFGFESLGLSHQDFEPENVIQLGFEPNRIDLLTQVKGLNFNEAYDNRAEGMYGKQKAFFINRSDLIFSKKVSNRSKDKSDIELLRKMQD